MHKNPRMNGIESWVMVRKNGPSSDRIIMRSKSTSWVYPWMMAVRITRTREYPPQGLRYVPRVRDTGQLLHEAEPILRHLAPPLPAASPRHTTGPFAQGLSRCCGSTVVRRGTSSYRSRRLISPSEEASISSRKKGSDTLLSPLPLPAHANSSRRRVSLGLGSSGVGFLLLKQDLVGHALDARCGASAA